ncbi:MAG: MFS transporter [Polyangiales bacterium]
MGRRLPGKVWALGTVSLLTDAASDMIYPLLPQLLTELGGAPWVLGVMEGVGELVASLVKVAVGRESDRGGRHGFFVVIGYGVATLARSALSLVSAPWQVVVARGMDRVGKGVRSGPRDAILAAATRLEQRGAAFGLHRAMDNFGAVIGGATAILLLRVGHFTIRQICAFALIPGLLSTAVAVAAVRKELAPQKRKTIDRPAPSKPSGAPLPPRVRAFLLAIALFSFGASADSFLLLRLSSLGLSLGWIPFAWITLQLGKALLNVPGGAIADRVGPRRVVVASWAVYGLAYVAFALAPSWPFFWAIFPLYALHYGLGEGAEKALMGVLAGDHQRGHAFGAQQAVHGAVLLPANVLFGLVYATHPSIAFAVSGIIGAVAAVALLLLVREPLGA